MSLGLYRSRHILCIIILLLFGSTILYGTNQHYIKNYYKNDYNAASQNWSVAFDDKGIAYFGNNTGLLEYDGVSWELHPSPNGSIIRAVETCKGKIYTGGYRELGFWEKEAGVLKYHSLTYLIEDKLLRNEEFWGIFVNDNKVYFQSFNSIYILDSNNFHVIRPGGFINYATKSEGNIFFAIKNEGIYKIEGNTFAPFIKSGFFKDKTVRFFATYATTDTYLIGTESNGIFEYNIKTNKFNEWNPDLTSFFIRNKINRGLVTDSSDIIIGTILNGIVLIDRNGVKSHHINVQKGLQCNTVLGISRDHFGNIWLALDKGIDFVSFPGDDGFKSVKTNEIGAIYTAALFNNELYLGTNQGLYRGTLGSEDETFKLVPNTQEQVWDCKIIDDKLFVGHNSGTFIIDKGRVNKISNYSGGYSIVRNPANPDLLIQSTYSNLVVYRKNRNNWELSHTIKDFNNLIRHLSFDHLNNLWASHLYQGVYKIKLSDSFDSIDSIRIYGKNSVLGKEGKTSYVFEIENRIVFTTGKTLYTYNDLNDSIVPYTFLNQKLGKYSSSYRIIPAPNHRYWFIAKTGLAYFEIYLNSIKLINEYPIQLFENQLIPGHENIIPINQDEALVCLENGYVIIDVTKGNSNGLFKVQKPRLKELITSDKHNNQFILTHLDSDFSIPYRKNSILVRYSFPFYTYENIKFQYKLEGLNDDWSQPIDKALFTIKRIPAGEYTLKVKAVNNWSVSSEIHQLKFRIKPPWYRSVYAIIGYILFTGMLALLLRYLSVKRIKIKEKRKRIEKEKEIIRLRNDKLRSELSFKSQQLASSTMGIIKKNEFLLSIKEKLKRQKEQLGTRYPDKYYLDIAKKIDNHISGQDDWKIFKSNFEQAHQEFLNNLKTNYPDLTSSDLRLCAYLRINLTSKEIAPLLGISVRSVENHRYRLRKKFNLSVETKLVDFILSL